MTETPSSAPIRLQFTLSFDDIQNARNIWRSPARYWLRFIVLYMIFIVFPIIAVSWYYLHFAPPHIAQQPMLLRWFPILVVAILVIGRTIYHFATRRKKWETRNSQKQQKITLNSEHLIIETPTTTRTTPLRKYDRFSESSTAFVLFPTDGGYHILPKRIMTPDQITQIRLLLQSHINKTHAFPILPQK